VQEKASGAKIDAQLGLLKDGAIAFGNMTLAE
jgi:hypothetical protein